METLSMKWVLSSSAKQVLEICLDISNLESHAKSNGCWLRDEGAGLKDGR